MTHYPDTLFIKWIPDGEFYLAEVQPFDGARKYTLKAEDTMTTHQEDYCRASGREPIKSDGLEKMLKPIPVSVSLLIVSLPVGILLLTIFIFSLWR